MNTSTHTTNPPPQSPEALIKQISADLGFAICGMTNANPSDYSKELQDWLSAGKHGQMEWLDRHVDVRIDPAKLLDGAKSIICVADYFGPASDQSLDDSLENIVEKAVGKTREKTNDNSDQNAPDPIAGRIARYAQISDYHKVIKKRLFKFADTLKQHWPDHTYRACVDTAPLLEREHAMRAGIGWTGKNTMLINPTLGSHIMLGQIITTLPLQPDPPQTNHCGTCTRCIDACPTDCLTPWSVDARRCISYLTIEHKQEIDEQYHQAIGDWLYGCDICQEVCPFVKKSPTAQLPDAYQFQRTSLDIDQVIGWTEQDRQAAFIKSAMKRAKLDPMRRNALIVAGNYLQNHTDHRLHQSIINIAKNPEESTVIRKTADSVLNRLNYRVNP